MRQFYFLVSKELLRLCDKCWLINKCAVGILLVLLDETEMEACIPCGYVFFVACDVTALKLQYLSDSKMSTHVYAI